MEKSYKSEIYRSKEGRHILHCLYRKHLMAMRVPISERMVETCFGDTHIVFYGNPQGIPVLFFCGENALNPLSIRPFTRGLDLEKICLTVPDLPGQTGFSSERKLSFPKGEYGEWACQVMDALELATVSVMGYSFGGSIALQLCKKALLRIERLMLVLPAGIVNTSVSKINKLLLPAIKRHKELTSDEIRVALSPILSFEQDELIEAAKLIMMHSSIETKGIDPLSKTAIHKFRSPVFVVAEKFDHLFPGDEVIRQARKIIPHVAGTRLLMSGCHLGLFKETDDNVAECYRAITDFILQTTIEG